MICIDAVIVLGLYMNVGIVTNMKKKIKITICIPEWIDKEVEDHCEKECMTKSGFITRCLIKEIVPFPEVVDKPE